MRGIWQCSLGLTLGLLAAAVQAGERTDSSPAASAVPAAVLGRPLTSSRPAAATVAPPAPAASLARPATTALSAMQDPAIRPAGYSSDSGAPSAVYRGAGPDDGPLRPIPSPSADPTTGVELHGWRRSPEALGMPRTADAPAPVGPAPVGPGPVAEGAPGGPACNLAHRPGCDCPDCGCGCRGGCGGGCGCNGGGGCRSSCGGDCCQFDNRWYVGAEYLLWWVKGDQTPPLVTTGSVNDAVPGALGQPHTQVLFGDSSIGSGARSGARFTAGWWFSDDHVLGLDGSFLYLGRHTNDFSATSFGDPPLFRPFHESFNNINTAEQVANVATSRLLAIAGTINIDHTSSFWGAEGNLRANIICGRWCFVDLIGGFRVLALDENLEVNESLVSQDTTGTGPRVGTTFNINDTFSTQNRFYGGQVGAVWEVKRGRWVIDGTFKLGLGATQQTVRINGSTVIANSGTSIDGTYTGGLLAQSTNIGSFSRNVFAVVPEAGVKVGYHFTDHLLGFLGYNFLWWSDVARPGNQIDPSVDRRLLAPPSSGANLATHPAFAFNGSSFWAQGLTLGLEYRY